MLCIIRPFPNEAIENPHHLKLHFLQNDTFFQKLSPSVGSQTQEDPDDRPLQHYVASVSDYAVNCNVQETHIWSKGQLYCSTSACSRSAQVTPAASSIVFTGAALESKTAWRL